MRLSSLGLTTVLLLSCFSLAQHQNAPTPPPPPPPPPPAVAPSPAPSFTPSAPSPAPESHVAAPSAPSTPAPAAPAWHASEPSAPSPAPAAASHAPEPDRVVADHKITGQEKVESAPRVGEDLHAIEPVDKNSPDKEKEAKPEPDLRRHLCGDKPCEPPEPQPVETENDLRHRPCVKEPCPCPPGQKTNAGGCVGTVVQNQCPAGQTWNGGTCIAQTCPPNQVWNGIQCVPPWDECLGITGRAAPLIEQLRDLKTRMEDACMRDPGGSDCIDLTREHAVQVEQYRAVFDQAPMACHNRLPDPSTL